MAHKHGNQSRSRKYGGTSSFIDASTPSKAPRQDEEHDDRAASPSVDAADLTDNETQGISNRPAAEEHAFPSAPDEKEEPVEVVDDPSKQTGGSRGQV